jgi:hypothetical protein
MKTPTPLPNQRREYTDRETNFKITAESNQLYRKILISFEEGDREFNVSIISAKGHENWDAPTIAFSVDAHRFYPATVRAWSRALQLAATIASSVEDWL